MKMKPAIVVMVALLFVLPACSDSGQSQQQYAEGAKAAQNEGCSCDPFVSDTQSAAQHSDAAQVGPHWRDGYINACVNLRQECNVNPKADKPTGTTQ